MDAAGNTVVVTVDGLTFNWSASIPIDAVIVKGGPNANLYAYEPEAMSNAGEPALHAPVNPSNGMYYGLSHIAFCFDYEVLVEKTADPSFERSYAWSLDKASPMTELLLSEGQVYTVPYTVTVDVAGHTDGDFRVAGAVTVRNPAPMVATLTGITDMLGQLVVPLDCGVAFPFELLPGATLECSYEALLGVTEMPAPLTNVAEVATTGDVGPGSATAVADFAVAEMREVDECVEVTDDLAGLLGTTCVGEAPRLFAYTHDAGPYACGEHELVNVAAFVANDTGATGSDSWTVLVTVPCELGCTLTPGYWKTHSEYGPAPYDATWAMLPDGADTPFFLSGQSYHQVLWTPPAGNAYYILARAFIAAGMNELNGASFTAAEAAWGEARAVFEAYTPAQIAALKGKDGSALRAHIVELAGVLDAYNNGLIGPGHCDE
jgi:hypothetical protein